MGDRRQLAEYRFKEALECIEEAELLLGGKKLRGAVNRIYYSMFYAASALLAARGLSASRHSGVISIFHGEFVKSGLFAKKTAKFLDIAFALRNKADYREFVQPEENTVTELPEEAKRFISQTEDVPRRLI